MVSLLLQPMQLLHETQFLASVSVYALYTKIDTVHIEAHETYQKRSLRNKCIIMGVNGPITLTLPLKKGKHDSKLIKEVEIAYHDSWIGDMLHAIRSAYGAAPYFDYYYPEVEHILRKRHRLLWSLNEDMRKLMQKRCGLTEVLFLETEAFQKSYDEQWIDIRSKKLKDYQPAKSDAEGYAQVFEDRHGFVDDLSILDALFCLGPETSLYLSRK